MSSVRRVAEVNQRAWPAGWLAWCALISLWVACSAPSPRVTSSPRATSSPTAARNAPDSQRPGSASDAWSPTPNPARGMRAVGVNDSCESCHTEIAKEWRGSMHQLAYVEPAYQRALAREPLAWCRRCHAPEADSRYEPPAKLAELGVGCVTCHLVGDQILAGAPPPPTQSFAALDHLQPAVGVSPGAHPVLRSLATSPAGACKNCHEFAFPDSALRQSPLLMQSTVSEHARSSASAQSCADCHMPTKPSGPGQRPHRDHRFGASRDPELLRRALTVSAQRGPGVVRFTLRSQGVGHAFPTGDLFRRLEVGVEVVGDDYRVLQRSTELLTRHFKANRSAGFAHRELLRDTRIGPTAPPGAGNDGAQVGERQVEIRVATPSPDARKIAWWVSYQRVAFPRAGEQEAEIEDDIILASGLLPLDERTQVVAAQGAP